MFDRSRRPNRTPSSGSGPPAGRWDGTASFTPHRRTRGSSACRHPRRGCVSGAVAHPCVRRASAHRGIRVPCQCRPLGTGTPSHRRAGDAAAGAVHDATPVTSAPSRSRCPPPSPSPAAAAARPDVAKTQGSLRTGSVAARVLPAPAHRANRCDWVRGSPRDAGQAIDLESRFSRARVRPPRHLPIAGEAGRRGCRRRLHRARVAAKRSSGRQPT